MAAPEDLIINRLYSAKKWKSNPQRDLEQAATLLRIFAETIDYGYLNAIAKRNDVADVLATVRKYASKL